jgi:hypothetical protein
MRWLALTVAVLAPPALAAQDSVVAPHRVDARTAAAFETWIAAVGDHRPGIDDAPLETVAAFSMVQRADLSAGMSLFLNGLENKGSLGSVEDAQMRVKQLGHRTAQNPGMLVFLKRAAVLHADAAIARPSKAIEAAQSSAAPGSRRREPAAETPLLTNYRLSAGDDGRELGEIVASWHWPFARFLLDVVEAAHPGDAFMADWYHATSALICMHKPQVYIDLSGWSPKYFSPTLVQYANTVAEAQRDVRVGLPVDHAREVDGRLRDDPDQGRSAAAHHERERGEAARAGVTGLRQARRADGRGH